MSRMKLGLILLAFVMVGAVAGCAPAAPAPAPSPKPAPAPAPTPTAPAPAPAEKAPAKVRFMSAAGGSPGGTYFYFGAGIAKVVTKYVPGIQMTSETTGGAVENGRLIALRKADIGQMTNVSFYFGGRGEKYTTADEAPKWRDIRAVSQGQVSTILFVTLKKSGINSIADLKGKRVSLGPVGGAQIETLIAMMDEYGVSVKDVKVQYMSYADGATALKEGALDAAALLGGIPTAAVLDLASTHDIRILEMPVDRIEHMRLKHKFPSPVVLPGGTYKGVPNSIVVPNSPSFVAVHKDMDEQLAYQIVKALCDHTDELVEIHPEMRVLNSKDGVTAIVPYHPGAIRYYQEQGTWDLRPKTQAKTVEEFLDLKK